MCSHNPTTAASGADTQSALLQAILTELQQVKANQTLFEHKVRTLSLIHI